MQNIEQLHFNFRDIFRVSRYGFSGRRIGIHFVGVLLAYLIYEILLYLSLFIGGRVEVQTFWDKYGLLPVPPFVGAEFGTFTTVMMWIGVAVFAAIFFLASTMTSKITVEQLRGDAFFSVRSALSFAKQHWKTVFGAFIGLLFIMLFLALIPLGVAGLGKIPGIGKAILMFASIFTPVAFLLGVLVVLIAVVFMTSLFCVPAVVATTGADIFETVYQHFSIVWHEPWRLIGYGTLLFVLKLVLVPIWAAFCLGGFLLAMLPMRYLHTVEIQNALGYANRWLGNALQELMNNFTLLDMNTSQPSSVMGVSAFLGVFITITLICIAGIVVAYLFSLASVGSTLIYTVVRKRTDGQNLLVPIGVVETMGPPPLPIGDE